jgi:hypothetical protein
MTADEIHERLNTIVDPCSIAAGAPRLPVWALLCRTVPSASIHARQAPNGGPWPGQAQGDLLIL